MNTTIWKFTLETTDRQTIIMPKHSNILTVQTQFGVPCLWAEVDPKREMEAVNIEIFGTGHPMPSIGLTEKRTYIGSYQLQEGVLVFHVFTVGERFTKFSDVKN